MTSWKTTFLLLSSLLLVAPCSGDEKIALLVVDVQNCFTPGGSLAVDEGDQVIRVINQLRAGYESRFDMVVLSQDWHCQDHVSFASQHPGYSVYGQISLSYLANGDLCSDNVTASYTVDCTGQTSTAVIQTLWPDHCVKNTAGAELHADLTRKSSDTIIRKGSNCQVDSYSLFYDNGRFDQTTLQGVLSAEDISTVYIVGLATDYCVYWTALDALTLNYTVFVVSDGTRGVEESTTEAAIADMKAKGVNMIDSSDLKSYLSVAPPAGGEVSYLVLIALAFLGNTLTMDNFSAFP